MNTLYMPAVQNLPARLRLYRNTDTKLTPIQENANELKIIQYSNETSPEANEFAIGNLPFIYSRLPMGSLFRKAKYVPKYSIDAKTLVAKNIKYNAKNEPNVITTVTEWALPRTKKEIKLFKSKAEILAERATAANSSAATVNSAQTPLSASTSTQSERDAILDIFKIPKDRPMAIADVRNLTPKASSIIDTITISTQQLTMTSDEWRNQVLQKLNIQTPFTTYNFDAFVYEVVDTFAKNTDSSKLRSFTNNDFDSFASNVKSDLSLIYENRQQ